MLVLVYTTGAAVVPHTDHEGDNTVVGAVPHTTEAAGVSLTSGGVDSSYCAYTENGMGAPQPVVIETARMVLAPELAGEPAQLALPGPATLPPATPIYNAARAAAVSSPAHHTQMHNSSSDCALNANAAAGPTTAAARKSVGGAGTPKGNAAKDGGVLVTCMSVNLGGRCRCLLVL